MMVLVVVGLTLVVGMLVDVYVTTISMRGAGPFSGRVMERMWRPAAASTRVSHRALEVYGSLVLPVTIALWSGVLLLGWTLVFAAHPDAVVTATTGAPAGWWERTYFAGYTISTLGNGELRPGGPVWQAFTVVASVSGLAIITLAITYVTPVMGAVVSKRRVARMIVGLGATPADVLNNGWDGQAFQRLSNQLTSLGPSLATLAQQHMAYPVLHYFHSAERDTALAPAVAVLDDMLTLMRFGVHPDHRLDPVTLHTTVAAVDVLLSALRAAHIDPARDAPAPPELSVLDTLEIPRVPDERYAEHADDLAERRALLLGFVKSDGWVWDD